MTVCIVAYSARANAIVTVSDWLLSNDTESCDALFKGSILHSRAPWYAHFAGEPEQFQSLRARIAARLRESAWPSYDDVLASISNACEDELAEIGDRFVLRPLGYTNRADFLRNGRSDLGPDDFSARIASLEDLRLQADLMVYGFDDEGRGHLASSNATGRASRRNAPPFFAIGSGAWAAQLSLNLNPDALVMSSDLEPVIYWLCAAKYTAQAATPSVGEKTVVMVHGPRGLIDVLFDGQLAAARAAWEGNTRSIPEGALAGIREGIAFAQKTRQLMIRSALGATQQAPADPLQTACPEP